MVPQIKSQANFGCIYSALNSILLCTFYAWVVCMAFGAKVAETTFGGASVADSIVPLVTSLV